MIDLQSLKLGLKRRYFQREFDVFCQAVLKTPAVELDESSGLVVLSQSYHKDLLMFLIAAKTFARHVKPALFVVVDDGYTPEDQAIIRAHLRRVDFIPRKSVSSPFCPVGGTWERLLTIADLSRDHYIVQLDSDTVTVADPVEVREHIAAAASFTLSTNDGRRFVTVKEASNAMKGSQSGHIQVLAEKALDSIPELTGSFYIRGCSGFAGFAPGSIDRDAVERISRLMSSALGSGVWKAWGSEQFASNYLIANSSSKALLPFENYPYWILKGDMSHARLIHFIGGDRFTSSAYRSMAMKAIRSL